MPTLLALLLGFGLMQMGNTLQRTLLTVRGTIDGFSPAQIGAVVAGFWVGIVIGSLRCGKLIQSWIYAEHKCDPGMLIGQEEENRQSIRTSEVAAAKRSARDGLRSRRIPRP